MKVGDLRIEESQVVSDLGDRSHRRVRAASRGVAGKAAAGPHQIFAAHDRIRLGGGLDGGRRPEEQGEAGERNPTVAHASIVGTL